MTLRPFFKPFAVALLCASVVTALPAQAQMYKWLDDKGVVSYSNTPPPATSTKKVEAIADRVSVYTPHDELKHAMSAEGRREARAETLGRKLEAERTARRPTPATSSANLSTADSRAAAYERCVAERRVDCESLRSGFVAGLVFEPLYGYNGYYPQFVVGARGPLVQPAPFFVSENPAPKVGISTTAPVGISTAPKVGIDERPSVGAPPRNRPVRQTR